MTRRVARPEFVPPLWKASEERPGGVISFLINGPAILANANLRPLPKVAGFFAYGRAHRSARSKQISATASLREKFYWGIDCTLRVLLAESPPFTFRFGPRPG